MSAQRVLVAFASRSGSTAGIADAIADVLRAASLAVDSRPVTEVTDVAAYDAVVLGSGVFLPRRASDGGGFLLRHAQDLATRAVWLFCAGPIGRGRGADGTGIAGTGDCSVNEVARAIGARGSAVFGTPVGTDGHDVDALTPVDLERVRGWAREIAAELRPDASAAPARPRLDRRARCARISAAR